MNEELIVWVILAGALFLFVQEKIRADAVALLALLACWATGLLSVNDAFEGFASRAVITVAAVLVIGRAIEATGAAAAMTRFLVPRSRFIAIRFGAVLILAVILSAFMNNIAALVITMPATIQVARDHRLPPSALLMSLAFATVLGGMTTLIGTPGNLLISSVRQDALGEPYGLFDMTLVGGAVAAAGLLYLLIFARLLTPHRESMDRLAMDPVRVFELELSAEEAESGPLVGGMRQKLRKARAVLLAVFRDGARAKLGCDAALLPGDRLLVMSKSDPWEVAGGAGLHFTNGSGAPQGILARVSVAHGSPLIGKRYSDVAGHTRDAIHVVGVGPRPARLKQPLETLTIEPGDQLFLNGPDSALGPSLHDLRLLEIDRQVMAPVSAKPAVFAFLIYAAAVASAALAGVPISIAFVVAALAMCLLRLVPANQIYSAIDWPIIVLLAAMIPVGRAFDESGATASVAALLGWTLSDASFPIAIAVLCGATMILSSFLNNVATALVMSEVAVEAAIGLGISIDAALLAVLIGSSCSFLTPIGHQNNLLVMRPGGYRFADYFLVGLPLTIIVIAVTTWVLATLHS